MNTPICSEMPQTYDRAVQTDLQTNSYDITAVLKLWMVPGCVYELRCPDTRKGVVSGYFNDLEALAFHAEQQSGNCPAVYLSLNPINPLFLYRLSNKVKPYSKDAVKDDGVIRRTRLLIDSDARLPIKNISSSEEEHDAALAGAREVRDWLATQGCPEPIYADSGNGGHLQYAIDLPNDDQHKELLSKFLMTIKSRFPHVEIDPTVFNASRICKVYGTMVCKGENMPDRPHRMARILEAPEQLAVVPVEFIHAVVGQPTVVSVQAAAPVHVTSPAEVVNPFEQKINTAPVEWPKDYDGDLKTLDIVKLFASRDLLIREGSDQSTVLCPWREEHTTGDSGTAIFRNTDGYPGFHCLHQHCKDRGIQDVLAWFGRSAVDAHCAKPFGSDNPWLQATKQLAEAGEMAHLIVSPFDPKQVGPSQAQFVQPDDVDFHTVNECDDFMGKEVYNKKEEQTRPQRRGFRINALSQFKPDPWQIEGHFTANSFVTLLGPSGVGKSFIALDYSLSVAAGMPYLGSFQTTPGGVVYVSSEGRSGIYKRCLAWLQHHNREAPENWIVIPDTFDMQEEEEAKALLDIAARDLGQAPALIILDTVARNFGPGDENNARDMSKFVLNCDTLRQSGATVLVVHHTGKDVERGGRGSSALFAATDTTIIVTDSPDKKVLVACQKQKDFEAFESYKLVKYKVTNADSLVLVGTPQWSTRYELLPAPTKDFLRDIYDRFQMGEWTYSSAKNEKYTSNRGFQDLLKKMKDQEFVVPAGTGYTLNPALLTILGL